MPPFVEPKPPFLRPITDANDGGKRSDEARYAYYRSAFSWFGESEVNFKPGNETLKCWRVRVRGSEKGVQANRVNRDPRFGYQVVMARLLQRAWRGCQGRRLFRVRSDPLPAEFRCKNATFLVHIVLRRWFLVLDSRRPVSAYARGRHVCYLPACALCQTCYLPTRVLCNVRY
eukprot:3838908-Rhodomonas_salina.2